MNYKKQIIKMVEGIDNQRVLEYLHRFIELFLERWG